MRVTCIAIQFTWLAVQVLGNTIQVAGIAI
jgi:hypothetical protein